MIDRVRSWLLWCWGILLFGILGSFILFRLAFFKPETNERVIRGTCRWFLRLLGIRLRLVDHGGRDDSRAYLFVANHVNLLDPFVFKTAMPTAFRAVELAEHFCWPLYGWIIRRLGHIPIERERPFQAMGSLSAAARALQNGITLIIFPEGSRTRDGKLLPFKRGAFLLAQTAGVDVVPVVQDGSFALNNKMDGRLRRGEVRVTILPPIRYVEFAMMDSRHLRDLVQEKMRQALE
jgi:1-acyl-sn-glycerol-3-phosphate acyltransferase